MSAIQPHSRRGKGLFFSLFTVLAIAIAAYVCISAGRKKSGTVAEVRIGYFANLSHAQAVLGVDSGEFASAIAPAQLKTKVFNAGPSLIEALFAGEIDIGYVGPGPALAAHARSKGQGIRVIAGASANGVGIVARAGSGIEKIEDLKNRRVATPQHGNTQDIAARHYLVYELHQSGHENVLPVPNAEQAAMMARGQIDAAWTPEPWASRLVAETGAKYIAQEKDLWPGGEFALAVVVTTPEFLHDHPDVVKKVLAVHRNWTVRLASEPKKYAPELGAALLKLGGKKLPAGVLESAVARVKFTDRPLEETFKTMAQWAYDLEFERRPARLSQLFDLDLLKSLESAGPSTKGAPNAR